ncbi:RNA polymerase sigma factor SigF [Streptomyces sp. WAC00288]|uniref:RNA polymerase sigma factor SigF n=2 Tax=Streptomyces cinereoruber TaxID=67260 RepID=A0ABX6BHE6_9ACTN|nr:RNA polymerase sigma factor SigF [Streptomyces sp. WAC00288]KYG55056.1 RNA polymerase subunit sigma [Streptomyces sp. WAC04657]PVC67497.1 RNA polymerase sigma factor SigF [Streptomyces sp. CS081A]QEV33848.1 RNA polymerase sigma factor SigF [Streptomyces cinereoruber]
MVAAFLRRSRHRDRPRPQGGGMSTELDSSKVLTLTPVPVVPVPTQTTAPTAPESAEPTPPPMPVTTGALDTRTLSRSLFLRLRALDAEGAAADSPERTYVRDTLIELNLPLVRYAAARFRSRNEPMEDIVQVGTIGLIKAIDRFDCERGVEFPTFAMPTVVGEIKRFFRDTSWSVRVPRRLQELRLALTKAGDELAQKLDRSPTVAELAAVLGVSEEDVVDGLAVGNAYTASSLDSPSPEDDGGEGSLADRLGYEDTALEGVEYRESLKPLLAKLPPRERQIIMLRFFANMTQSQIGEEVGISQMHVSRLLTRTLAQLRDGLISD